MIIGLYDADISKYTHVPFNLELMKIASYYKKKMEIVTLSPSFLPDLYQKFIYRKDYYDNDFPKGLEKIPNIEYGGHAFTLDKYFHLAEEIERQKADINIYNKIEKDFCTNKWTENAFKVMQRAEHFRLSLDNQTIWKDFEKQLNINTTTQTLFLHDYNLNTIKDSDYIIKDLMKLMPSRRLGRNLAVKFPITVDNTEDLFRWCQFNPSEKFFLLQYNGLMSDEVLKDFVELQKGTSIARQLTYCVTSGCLTEEQFIKERIQKIFRQIAFLRMERTKIYFTYEANFFKEKKWERLIEFFNSYLNSTINLKKEKFDKVIKYDSLYSFAFNLQEEPKIKTRTFSKQEARELFHLVRQNNYELFKDFYECHTVSLKGGNFENE